MFEKIDFHEFIESLTDILEMKDFYTRGHSHRVAEYSTLIAKELNLPYEDIFFVHMAGHLHDIGKVGISDSILNKKGSLSPEEYEIIKTHSTLGYNILKKVKGMEDMALVIKHHHERWDGRGYPDSLKEDKIPFFSRIISIADSFDAMTSSRVYRNKLGAKQACLELIKNSGSQFDPELIKVFIKVIKIKGDKLISA